MRWSKPSPRRLGVERHALRILVQIAKCLMYILCIRDQLGCMDLLLQLTMCKLQQLRNNAWLGICSSKTRKYKADDACIARQVLAGAFLA